MSGFFPELYFCFNNSPVAMFSNNIPLKGEFSILFGLSIPKIENTEKLFVKPIKHNKLF